MSITVSVGETNVSVTVSPETSVAVVASGGIGPAGFLTAPGTATNAFGTFQLVPGPGITMSTSAGVFLLSGYSTSEIRNLSAVMSVASRTGAVELVASDVTAGVFDIARIPTIGYTALSGVPTAFTPATHTHDASAVQSGTLSIARIPTISYTSLSNVPTSFTPSSHTHSTTDIVSFTAAAAAAAPVQSVQGKVGAVSLVVGDLTAAAAVHTHDAADVVSGVLSVARIPTISYTALSNKPTSFPPDTSIANVVSVNGITGTPEIVAGSNVTVTTAGSQITVSAAGGGGASLSDVVPQPLGVASAGTSTSASRSDHVHAVSTIAYTALSGVPTAFTPATHTHDASDVTAGVFNVARIPTIGYTALSGVPLRFRWTTQTITANAHNHTVGDYEVVRVSMSTAYSLTGFSDGSEGKSHRVINLSTNLLTFQHQHTSSNETNRLLIATGLAHAIDQDEQAEFLYDPTSQRWRMTPCCTTTAAY